MHKHKFKFLRQSVVSFEGKETPVTVFQCMSCGKLGIMHSKTGEKVNLKNAMGEEACL